MRLSAWLSAQMLFYSLMFLSAVDQSSFLSCSPYEDFMYYLWKLVKRLLSTLAKVVSDGLFIVYCWNPQRIIGAHVFVPSNAVWEPFNSEHKILQASGELVIRRCASCLGKLPAQPAIPRRALVWTRSQLSVNAAWCQTRHGLRSLRSVPIVISDFTEITAPCHFTVQLCCSSSRVGKQSSACSRLWRLLVADSQSRPNYSWDHERGEMRDALDKASFQRVVLKLEWKGPGKGLLTYSAGTWRMRC